MQRVRASPENLIRRIVLPGFRTLYPTIVNAERIPAPELCAMEQAWTLGDVPASEAKIFRFKNVYVAGEGLVFDKDLRLINASATFHVRENIELAYATLQRGLAAGQLKRHARPALLCVQPGLGNYGHWLVEMLPKIWFGRQHLPDLDLSYLTPNVAGPMGRVISDSLRAMRVEPRDIATYEGYGPARVDDLVMINGLTWHGKYMSRVPFGALDAIAAEVPAGAREMIYVRRRQPNHRRFVDDDQVCIDLEKKGFAIVSPEDHTLAEQIGLFKGARLVLGTASAALTNIAFCRPGTKVMIFYPATMADTFYWYIAQHRGLDYLDIRCRQVGPVTGLLHWDTDLARDVTVFDGLVEGAMARLGRSEDAPGRAKGRP